MPALDSWFKDEAELSLGLQGGNSGQLGIIVTGTEAEYVVYQMGLARAPGTYFGLNLSKIDLKKVGYMLWDVTANYGDPEKNKDPDDQSDTFSFDTTGGTHKLTNSYKTRKKGRGLTGGKEGGPDFKGAIGVKGNDVEGCEIVIPKLTFSVKRTMFAEQITSALIKTWSRVTGKTNSKPFKDFAAGELLYMGATGNGKYTGAVDVEHHFAASENLDNENLTIGGIEIKGKKGWEYLWVYYTPQEDTAVKSVIPRPEAIYIEVVYREIDFGILGLGSSMKTRQKRRAFGA